MEQVITKAIIKFAYVIVQVEKMIKTLKELRDMDISEGCPKIEGLPDTADPTKYYPFICGILSQKWIKVEDVKSLIESTYNKYVVPDNVNGVNTEHIVIGGVRFKTLVNHPISAMRAQLLEQLEANQKKDLPENKDVSSTKDE